MDAVVVSWLVDASLRAALVVAVAGAVGALMRRAPARLRGAVWAAALIGATLVPVASALLPPLAVPLPALRLRVEPVASSAAAATTPVAPAVGRQTGPTSTRANPPSPVTRPAARRPWWSGAVLLLWAGIGLGVLGAQLVAALRLRRIVRRAAPVEDGRWRGLLEAEARRVGLVRVPRLVVTSELATPATAGLLRPVVLIPDSARWWVQERRAVVLRHELVHVARFDWAVRAFTRAACAVYWFNPLVWWAWRRLAVDQELACDQEVLALGARPSTYAAHLLAVARIALALPAPSGAALGMARRSHLEGRIMAILDPARVRRVGLDTLLPAVLLTLACAAGLAAVRPASADPPASTTVRASSEVRQIVEQIRELEGQIEQRAEQMEGVEEAMRPRLDEIEAHAARVGELHAAEIEARLEPFHERVRELELEMEPLHAAMAELAASIEPVHLEIDTSTVREQLARLETELEGMGTTVSLDELMDRIHGLMEPLRASLEAAHLAAEPRIAELETLHERLEPYHDRIEEIHREMEPTLEQIERMHLEMEPHLAQLDGLHEALEPFHEQMEAFQREIEPLTDEIDALAERLRLELRDEVSSVLKRELAAVVEPGAPFAEAAERLLERANLHLEDDLIELRVSRREARRVLRDLMTPVRRGGVSDADLDAAIDAAAASIRSFELVLD